MKLKEAGSKKNLSNVKMPGYDRSRLTPGIVHIGVGNFHRAHQAWYLHRLMEMGLAHDWAIIGAGVRPYDEKMRQKLAGQEYLTTLIELSPERNSIEIIGSMIDYVPVEKGNRPLIVQMADPCIRIVSTTVTEGGYYTDPASKGFDAQHPDIQHDVANPHQPRTLFAAIIAALGMRRKRGLEPFTCQSYDNLQGNGRIMRQTIVSLARMSDPDLAEWIDEHCSFPNSMVDCIVPKTGAKELALVREFGIEDQVPVTHENFRQWVTEDSFCSGRPQWEKVGVTISDQVGAYETMKIRILNGGHQLIAVTGDLLGIETVSAAMENTLIKAFFYKVEYEEIMPHVVPVPEYTPESYVKLIGQRFYNPEIVDTTRRVAFDGSSRQSGFILPSIRDCLAKGIEPNGLALASAIWARYCYGQREDGSWIKANDPYWSMLQTFAKKAKKTPRAWLENSMIYGDLGTKPQFVTHFVRWLSLIYDQGLEASLREYLDE